MCAFQENYGLQEDIFFSGDMPTHPLLAYIDDNDNKEKIKLYDITGRLLVE